MKTFVAIVQGFFSGFLIYLGLLLLIVSPGAPPNPALVAILLVGGWAASAYFLRRGARSVSKVFCRGFLLGAAEWFAMIGVGFIFSGKIATQTIADTGGAGTAGAALGGGMMSALTGGVSLFMALVCLVGFVIAHHLGKEMKPEAQTKPCPRCAEPIQAAATYCRFCNLDFAKPVSVPVGAPPSSPQG